MQGSGGILFPPSARCSFPSVETSKLRNFETWSRRARARARVSGSLPFWFRRLRSARATCTMRSMTLAAYPHSLSYHAMSLTRFGPAATEASASNTHDLASPTKSSPDAFGLLLVPDDALHRPLRGVLNRGLDRVEARRALERDGQVDEAGDVRDGDAECEVGVASPAEARNTFPILRAVAPEVVGTMFARPLRPRRQSFAQCASTTG